MEGLDLIHVSAQHLANINVTDAINSIVIAALE